MEGGRKNLLLLVPARSASACEPKWPRPNAFPRRARARLFCGRRGALNSTGAEALRLARSAEGSASTQQPIRPTAEQHQPKRKRFGVAKRAAALIKQPPTPSVLPISCRSKLEARGGSASPRESWKRRKRFDWPAFISSIEGECRQKEALRAGSQIITGSAKGKRFAPESLKSTEALPLKIEKAPAGPIECLSRRLRPPQPLGVIHESKF